VIIVQLAMRFNYIGKKVPHAEIEYARKSHKKERHHVGRMRIRNMRAVYDDFYCGENEIPSCLISTT